MRLNRFFIPAKDRELRQELWIDDAELVHQWQKVLRFKVGDELILFDETSEKLYRVENAEENAYKLQHLTDMVPQIPTNHVYLFFSLLKKDKNDWVLQKCTELGVRNFIPIISDRTETNSFDEERAHKIVTEAAEQCGRGDLPTIHEPISFEQAIETYSEKIDLFLAHIDTEDSDFKVASSAQPSGILIGPEGGWTESELKRIEEHGLQKIRIAQFTLRAETACIVGAARLLERRR